MSSELAVSHDAITAKKHSDAIDMLQVTPPTEDPVQKRHDRFQWCKPPEMDRSTLTATARMEAALAMEAEVRQKELVIRTLVKQLKKANEEKYRLVCILSRYRGPDRERLYRENKVLKERLDRVTRENLMLRGLDRREKNGKLSRSAV